MFAHIENLGELISNIRKLINKDTILVIENHYLGSIIEKKQFDTFYHEHPRTYSFTSFLKMSKILKMNLFKFKLTKRYGGNIRVFYSQRKSKNFKHSR